MTVARFEMLMRLFGDERANEIFSERALVQSWLDAMDDDKREVFILAELEQLSAREIGEATSTNPSTVYSRLRAARQAFEAAAARHRKAEGRRA